MITNYVTEPKGPIKDLEALVYHSLSKFVREFDKQKNNLKIWMIVILAIFFICLIFGLVGGRKEITYIAIPFLLGAVGLYYYRQSLKPTHSITKIGLVGLPVSQLSFQNKSILIDRSGLIDPVVFSYPAISDKGISEIYKNYQLLADHLNHFPVVLTSDKSKEFLRKTEIYNKENLKLFKEEADYVNILEEIINLYKATEILHENISALKKNSGVYAYLAANKEEKIENSVEDIQVTDLRGRISKVDGLVENYYDNLSKTIDIDELSLDIMKLINKSLPRMSYCIGQTIDEITIPGTFLITTAIKNAMYNYYCPSCNSDSIQRLEELKYYHDANKDHRFRTINNTKMYLIDLENNVWRCPQCDQESTEPFARHKLEDELFTPLYDVLYEEHFKDRLAIYNHIDDEKRKFKEKQESAFDQVFRESRAAADSCKSKIRTAFSSVRANERAVQMLNELLIKYKRIELERAKEIQENAEKLKAEVAMDVKRSMNIIDKAHQDSVNDIKESTERNASLEREDQKKRDEDIAKIAHNSEKSLEIDEVYAERAGMNKRSWFGLGSSERERVNNKNN